MRFYTGGEVVEEEKKEDFQFSFEILRPGRISYQALMRFNFQFSFEILRAYYVSANETILINFQFSFEILLRWLGKRTDASYAEPLSILL